jgi:SynChlorMet cassette radical SAM/SPASM protein ScmF
MAKLEPNQVPALSQLYVYVTNVCNCACKHCWIIPEVHPSKKAATWFLPLELMKAAIEEAKPLGLSSIKWTGGEPTIHPDFPALLELQHKYQLKGRLETNGMEVSRALAELLFASGIYHIAVSLDGALPETHDSIRGIRGAHRRTLKGFKNLVEVGFRPQVIMSLMMDNLGELDELLTLAEIIGAGSVKLNLIQPTLRGLEIHHEGRSLSVAKVLELNRRLACELRSRHAFPIFLDIPMAFRSIDEMLDANLSSVCGIKTILGLLADGSYALCGIGENLPELVFGVAGLGELDRIWRENPLLLKIRHDLPGELEGVCGRCLMKKACLGSCLAQNYYRERDIKSAFWFCDQAAQEGFFPQARLRD